MEEKVAAVDMSSKAIDQRLRALSGLYKLGMSLKRAQPMGPVRDLEQGQQAD